MDMFNADHGITRRDLPPSLATRMESHEKKAGKISAPERTVATEDGAARAGRKEESVGNASSSAHAAKRAKKAHGQ